MAKLTKEEFVVRAIRRLRTPGGRSKGIHSVFSGFNKAFRAYYNEDPVQAVQALARAGKVYFRFCKGGAMLYIPGEQPRQRMPQDIVAQLEEDEA